MVAKNQLDKLRARIEAQNGTVLDNVEGEFELADEDADGKLRKGPVLVLRSIEEGSQLKLATPRPVTVLGSLHGQVFGALRVKAGDLLYFDTWGGGGWGKPTERPAEVVAKDVERGLVTVEGARRYGVVLTEDFGVDEPATRALREEMDNNAGTNGLFNRGGSVNALLEQCLVDTGLVPPTAPEFR